jgi:hypothetical protein
MMNTLQFNLERLFDPHNRKPELVAAMRAAVETHTSGGLYFHVNGDTHKYERQDAFDPKRLYMLFEWGGDGARAQGWWISAPISLLLAPQGSFKLYHVRLWATDAPDELTKQMRAGYYGVTGRPVWTRWNEHYDMGLANTGFALHSAMNAAHTHKWGGVMEWSLCAAAETLKEIYALEEAAVAAETLLPKGLNVIPGGYAGIRLLHKLGLTKNKKPNPEQRDEVLLRLEKDGRAGPSAHYRRGHVRCLSSERKTWVRACFVALSGLLPEGLCA